MGDLAAGVDACVGSSCCDDCQILLQKFPKRGFHHALNCSCVELKLPSGEIRAVVFQCQFHSSHKQKIPPQSGTPFVWTFFRQNDLLILIVKP